MTILAVGPASPFGVGGLLAASGWETMNGLMLLWLALAALWLGARGRGVRQVQSVPG